MGSGGFVWGRSADRSGASRGGVHFVAGAHQHLGAESPEEIVVFSHENVLGRICLGLQGGAGWLSRARSTSVFHDTIIIRRETMLGRVGVHRGGFPPYEVFPEHRLGTGGRWVRSEEDTSELPPLMH